MFLIMLLFPVVDTQKWLKVNPCPYITLCPTPLLIGEKVVKGDQYGQVLLYRHGKLCFHSNLCQPPLGLRQPAIIFEVQKRYLVAHSCTCYTQWSPQSVGCNKEVARLHSAILWNNLLLALGRRERWPEVTFSTLLQLLLFPANSGQCYYRAREQ